LPSDLTTTTSITLEHGGTEVILSRNGALLAIDVATDLQPHAHASIPVEDVREALKYLDRMATSHCAPENGTLPAASGLPATTHPLRECKG
jgi:hypothetical protein